MSTRILLPLATALLLVAAATAQTAPAPAPAAQVAGAEHAAGTATRDKDTLSVDFPDEDIKTILRNVADLFELNLVIPDTLVGKTSIKLRDVTWRQIFQVVLSSAGYTFVEEGNIIKIVSADSLATEPVSTEVFILNNAKAQDIKPTVEGLVDASAGGKILTDVRSNALVVTERPSRMTRIRVIVEQLDKATAQVMIESKFVEVSDSDIRDIGVNWASLQGWRVGVGEISHDFSRSRGQSFSNGTTTSNGTSTTTTNGRTTTSTNGITGSTNNGTTGSTGNTTSIKDTTTYVATPSGITGTTNNFGSASFNPTTGTLSGIMPNPADATLGAAKYVPEKVDPTTGVVTPATYTAPYTFEGAAEVTNASGTTSSTASGTSSSTAETLTNGVSNTVSNAVNNLLGLTNTGGTNRLTSAVFSAADFNVVLSALKQQSNTKVVSNPTIVTLNNAEATINVGSEYPIPSYTYNSERGTFEVSGFQYKPIGVILKVTPQVNAQGTIRLALEPEISSSSRTTSFGGAGGALIPVIDTRKVKTQVSLKDGYTAGIGGLIAQTKAHSGTKVPVLGSIPVLGRLFSSKSVNDQTTNLLIFITAKSVNSDGAAPEDVFSASALQAAGEEANREAKK